MAILVNWFEVTFERKDCSLPFIAAPSWEASADLLKAQPAAEIVRVRQPDGSINLYFVSGTPPPNARAGELVLAAEQRIATRLIEYNLAQFFTRPGTRVHFDYHWGVEATNEVQSFPTIGLTIHQGISAKYFADTESKVRHGITLNWIVRPFFTKPISALPSRNYDGFPVRLNWPATLGPCPEPLAPFAGRYLGTIVEPTEAGYRVAVRDQSQQDLDARALYLEPRPEVLAEMEKVLARESGQASIQRRILQLTHSLKPDGRRNPGILRDQLSSALRFLDPSDRGQVSIPLRPNAAGQIWINCYATGVQRN